MRLATRQSTGQRAKRVAAVTALVLVAYSAGPATAAEPLPAHPESVVQGVDGEGTPAVVLDENRVESLLGKEVSGPGGEKLGRIVDVLVSRNGELRAAVIDFGGFLGVGTRKVAVAWSTLTFDGAAGPVLGMTADELRVTPEYRVGEPVVVVGTAKGETSKPAQSSPSPPAGQ